MFKSKTCLLGLILVSNLAHAQMCTLTERTVSREAGIITEVRNIQSEILPWKGGAYKCAVSLEGKVNGQWASGRGEFIWNGQVTNAQACNAAAELAKKNLTNSLKSSILSSESVVVCKEGKESLYTKIGDIIDDVSVLRPHPKWPRPFKHDTGEECRWYIEAGWNGKDVQQFHGIACSLGPTRWVIVDKF